MRKFLIIVMALILITTNCSAMTFSQPVEIGQAGCPDQAPYAGVVIKGASANNGNYWTKDDPNPRKGNMKTYGKGIARWGNGLDALYCRYNYETRSIEYGGQNNYIVNLGSSMRYISKIQTDEGTTLYSLFYGFHYSDVVIIGKRKDGKWVKYIDTSIIDEQYFGKNLFYMDRPNYKKIIAEGDTIILKYKIFKTKSEGEFRFKWNDKAQWFSVEQLQ